MQLQQHCKTVPTCLASSSSCDQHVEPVILATIPLAEQKCEPQQQHSTSWPGSPRMMPAHAAGDAGWHQHAPRQQQVSGRASCPNGSASLLCRTCTSPSICACSHPEWPRHVPSLICMCFAMESEHRASMHACSMQFCNWKSGGAGSAKRYSVFV